MKIAFAMINCNRRDGSARAVVEVAEGMAKRGHDVHLFARHADDTDLQLIKWHRVPTLGWPEVADFGSYYFNAPRMLAREKFDIVHTVGCNLPKADVITIQNIQPAKVKILKKIAAEENVSAPRRFTRWLYLKTTAAAERRLYTYRPGVKPPMFLPVSRGVEAELKNYYQIGPAPVRIVPNAADLNIFKLRSEDERMAWRREQGLAADDIVMLFCGGEWARKGLDLALPALAKVPSPKVKLFVAGNDPDRERFLKLVEELGVAPRVIFGGFRKDIPQAAAASDLFFFPSRYEAFSLATIEAAACGLPIVASKINGTEDFIQPGVTGEFVPFDVDEIARVLQTLVNQPERLREMGRAARELVERSYTWDKVTEMTESAYREYLAWSPNSR